MTAGNRISFSNSEISQTQRPDWSKLVLRPWCQILRNARKHSLYTHEGDDNVTAKLLSPNSKQTCSMTRDHAASVYDEKTFFVMQFLS